jgi:putative ABC transport system ATP-binding protein
LAKTGLDKIPKWAGFQLQASSLIPYLTVAQNIALPAKIAKIRFDPSWYQLLNERLALTDLQNRYPNQISVGQRQRASIARAMLTRPKLILMDEPVSALDPTNVHKVERLIIELAQDAGSAIVLASHQVDRGAFARERRATHRVIQRDAITYSLFSATPNEPRAQ